VFVFSAWTSPFQVSVYAPLERTVFFSAVLFSAAKQFLFKSFFPLLRSSTYVFEGFTPDQAMDHTFRSSPLARCFFHPLRLFWGLCDNCFFFILTLFFRSPVSQRSSSFMAMHANVPPFLSSAFFKFLLLLFASEVGTFYPATFFGYESKGAEWTARGLFSPFQRVGGRGSVFCF